MQWRKLWWSVLAGNTGAERGGMIARVGQCLEHLNHSTMAKKAAKHAGPAKKTAAVALGKLPAGPSKDEVKIRVLAKIDVEAGRNHAPEGKRTFLRAGDETLNLETDLMINGTRRTALSADYTGISTSYEGGKIVGQLAAKGADTVKKAIALVHKRAGGK